MTDRNLRILELRKRGMFYSDIGKRVGCSYSWVYLVLKKHRPDLTGRRTPYRGRRYTRAQVEDTLMFRRTGLSKEQVRKLTGIGWDKQMKIYRSTAPELINLQRNQDADVLALHAAGLSHRAITRRTGKPKSTVGNIIRRHREHLA